MNELEIIQYRQIEGLSVFFDTVDYRTSHVHPEWELIWLLESPLAVTCGAEKYRVEPGQMILFNPNEPHEFHKTGASATFLCLQISPAVLPEVTNIYLDGKLPHSYFSPAEMDRLKENVLDILRAYISQEPWFTLYCMGKSCLVLHQILRGLPSHILTPEESSSIDKRNARLKRLIRFVDENYSHKIRLEDFAAAEGCSMSYLSRFIKNNLNQNFQAYVTSVRFNCACKLIAEGGKQMLDVCMESGFSDYRYFSREFQKQYGMTPEEYSRYVGSLRPEPTAARHSLHSIERFYTREESLILMERYFS